MPLITLCATKIPTDDTPEFKTKSDVTIKTILSATTLTAVALALLASRSARIEGGFDVEGWRVAPRDAPGMLLPYTGISDRNATGAHTTEVCASRPDDLRTVWPAYEWPFHDGWPSTYVCLVILSDTL